MIMKRFHMFLMAGVLACTSSVVYGQALSGAGVMSDDINGGKYTDILVVGGNRTTLQYKMQPQEVDPRQLPYSRVKALYFYTPNEYIAANENFQNAQYKEARAKFAETKTKYQSSAALPGNYSVEAAFMEVDCAVRLLDWPGVKALSSRLTKENYLLTGSKPGNAIVYDLLGKLADNKPDEVINAANGLLAKRDVWSLEQLARISYALGVSYSQKGDTEKALNNLAMAIAAQHGGGLDLAADAMVKSMDILAADKSVTDYVASPPADLNVKERMKAPQKVQELSSLVYLYKNILFPGRSLDAKYDAYLSYFVTPTERTKAQEEAQKAAEQEAATEGKGEQPAAQPDQPAPPAEAPPEAAPAEAAE